MMSKKKKPYEIHSQLALPFLETNQDFLNDIFRILELRFGLKRRSKQKLIDLGSGDGRVIIYSALTYGIKSIGVEISKNLIKEAKNNVKLVLKRNKARKKDIKQIKIIPDDFFQQILENYDYVYIFSLPTMHEYLQHVFDTARIGATIISHKYPLTQKYFTSLKLDYTLKHEVENPEIFTYYYTKF
jgi:cyclopropane fatty-acyl-phospholipid synthase-like methyltransferase